MAIMAPSLSSLPDDLLIRVLRDTGAVQERHKAQLPLVCRRWHGVLHSPQLLASVCIRLTLSSQGGSAALQSLFSWLKRRAAGRVQQLELSLECPALGYGALAAFTEEEYAFDVEQGEAELWASVRACGEGGQLRQLSITLDSQLYVDPQVLGPTLLSSLRRLELDASLPGQDPPEYGGGPASPTLVAFGLEAATALRELRLSGAPLGLSPGGLPPDLTKLRLSGYTEGEGQAEQDWQCLPPQLGTLTQLRWLCLEGVESGSPADYAALASLQQLEFLSLVCCYHLPACLPELVTLRMLHLHDTPEGFGGDQDGDGSTALSDALSALTGLTHLALNHVNALPAALAGATQLRSFFWEPKPYTGEAISQLPAGPWLSGLQQLGLTAQVAAANLAALAAAGQLQALCVQGYPQDASLLQVAEAASQHPTLGTLGIAFPLSQPDAESVKWRALCLRLQALHLRPTLNIEPGRALLASLSFTDERGRLAF